MAHLQITPQLRLQLQAWLMEDLGRGDLTAPALRGRSGRAHWLAKADGRFCGGVLLEPLLQGLDPRGTVRLLVEEGAAVRAGQRLLELDVDDLPLHLLRANRVAVRVDLETLKKGLGEVELGVAAELQRAGRAHAARWPDRQQLHLPLCRSGRRCNDCGCGGSRDGSRGRARRECRCRMIGIGCRHINRA